MNERRAIQLCVEHRDPIGFEYLVEKYRREAHMHAYALLGNADDAAEACQESFASAFTSISRLGELTAFYPWFYRILRNRCLNVLSRARTAATYARHERSADAETSASPETEAIRKEESERVWAALGKLKLEYREILALKFMRGYDYSTLSTLIGIPRGTVMSRLYHARRAFRDAYLDQSETPITGDRNHG
jgi:RNA polymerase sigma-70 factor (ECF subfamily)